MVAKVDAQMKRAFESSIFEGGRIQKVTFKIVVTHLLLGRSKLCDVGIVTVPLWPGQWLNLNFSCVNWQKFNFSDVNWENCELGDWCASCIVPVLG